MRLVKMLVVLLLVPTLMWAQSTTGSTSTNTDTPNVSEQINKLSDAIAAQQAQIAEQQKELETLRKQLAEQKVAANAQSTPHVIDASLNTSGATTAAAQTPPGGPPQPEAQGTGKTSPLSFRIGAAEFTPGGFIDFTNVFRSTNTGNIVSTAFQAIPFGNAATGAGHLTELRTTSQYSRLSLKMASKVLGGDMTGYIETDFNGNDPANVFVSAQNHVFRLRLAYMEYKRGPVQLIAGQTWGWLTPNRVGLGTAGTDVMVTNNSDANINVGINYTRPSALHVILRPNSHFGWGFGIETQQQFTGGGVTFPSAFATQLAAQTDAGATPGAPALHPGILSKIAFDSNPTGRNFHFEVAGILETAKVALPVVGGAAGQFATHTKTGGGIQPAFIASLTKNFRVMANAYYSNGGGRQIIGMGPDFVVRPDGTISLVHSGAGLAGVEAQVTPSTLIAAYYGVAYFKQNFFRDTTVAAQPFIGYGFPVVTGTAGLTQNRAIQEPTLDISHSFWKNPQWGSLVLNLQSSYITRSPWSVANNPKNAHLFQQYVVFRYILP